MPELKGAILKLTPQQQVTAYLYSLRTNPKYYPNEMDGSIIETIEHGYAVYDPLNDELKITPKGKKHLQPRRSA